MYDFDGDFETIYTGETDVRLTGLIDKYNGDANLPQWTGKCANVQNYEIAERNVIKDAILEIVINLSVNA